MQVSIQTEGFSLNDLQRRNWARMEARLARRIRNFPGPVLQATFRRDEKSRNFAVKLRLQLAKRRLVTGKEGHTLTQTMDAATDAMIRSINGVVEKLSNRPDYRVVARSRRRSSS